MSDCLYCREHLERLKQLNSEGLEARISWMVDTSIRARDTIGQLKARIRTFVLKEIEIAEAIGHEP